MQTDRILSKRIGLEANGPDYKQTDRILSKRIGLEANGPDYKQMDRKSERIGLSMQNSIVKLFFLLKFAITPVLDEIMNSFFFQNVYHLNIYHLVCGSSLCFI
jgi:hypothetical protein